MIHKKILAAAVLSVSLVAPVASALAPAAQAEETSAYAAAQASNTYAAGQVLVNTIHIGDKHITGKVEFAAGEKSKEVGARFDRRVHVERTTVTRENTGTTELVPFSIPIPNAYELEEGEPITVGIVGHFGSLKPVFVEKRIKPEPPKPGQTPGGDNAPGEKPGATPKPPQRPGGGNGGMMLGSSGSSNLFG
ncbi:hypothetical protein [Corynebacterium propinquum]|uniref:hypothetical protein n=1 Tax=Corynebacterium propinquum TaxID=43769 RepID=UPI00191CB4CC|nr:hypothetical protein [Corynebacterium propinquum]QQU86889.1 hypothetical protein I6I70_04445 [Corynebacterium propinquum]